jgi:adenine C2-methylase RlmN of 23S rRNA A2503 and tRNA A37
VLWVIGAGSKGFIDYLSPTLSHAQGLLKLRNKILSQVESIYFNEKAPVRLFSRRSGMEFCPFKQPSM